MTVEENLSSSSPVSKIKDLFGKLKNANKKTVISFGLVILLIAAIPIGVYLVQQKQIFKPKASETRLVTSPETSFTLISSATTVAIGQEVRVLLYARADIDAANLFTAKLKFPANLLKVASVNTTSSHSASLGQAVKGVSEASLRVSKALALSSDGSYCAQVITRACDSRRTECKDFPTPCDVPVGWVIDNGTTGSYCAQVITRACDLRSTVCKDFPTPCDVPVGWRIDNSTTPILTPTTTPPVTVTSTPTNTPTTSPTPIPVNKDYFISNWMEKVPDNTAGTISLSGGVPSPGFKSILGQDSRVMAEIVFTALANGDANITFEPDSAIYKNSDNTNILGVKRDVAIKVGATPTPINSSARRVFVTSTTYNGNLGGLTGADAKCKERANAANLGGDWKAWLSNSTISATSRLIHNTAGYNLIDGTVVANSWNDLVDGTIQNPINVNELSQKLTTGIFYSKAWTNTTSTGAIAAGGHCANWTGSSATINGNGQAGIFQNTDSQWTLDGSDPCSVTNTNHLYCFEQTPQSTGLSCDVNDDGTKDTRDGILITGCWNKSATGNCARIDIDGNGTITTTDIQKFSYACPEIFATPTPTSTLSPIPSVAPTATPIQVNELGITISNVKNKLTIQPGQTQSIFAITSIGSTGISMYGYPTTYGPGINWNLSSVGLTTGRTIEIKVQVNSNVLPGIYSGSATIISAPSQKRYIIPNIEVTVPSQATASASAQVTTGIKGDINGDGKVNLVDMSILLSRFGKQGTEAGKADIYPTPLDGKVTVGDYGTLVQILIQNGTIKK